MFDNYYGTGRAQLEAQLAAGQDVLLEIDWQGARQVRAALPSCTTIFILPPSRAALEQRLQGRGTDSDEVIARRLADAVADMSHWREFDYVVVNDRFDQAVAELLAILDGRRRSAARRPGRPGRVRWPIWWREARRFRLHWTAETPRISGIWHHHGPSHRRRLPAERR